MRPTKGEISCTLAWPQATAWQNENSRVRLVWMPRSSSWRAASMPSQVEAILMSTRSMCTPSAWYSSIRRSARATVAEVLNDRRASTSVETRPGMVFRISQPKRTSMRSMTSSRLRPLYWATVARISGAYSGFCTALRMSEGLVVASRGWNWASWWKSPVSATTVVYCRSASSWFMEHPLGGSLARGGIAPGRCGCTGKSSECMRAHGLHWRQESKRRLPLMQNARWTCLAATASLYP